MTGRMTSVNIIKENLRLFSHTTSVKGIPKIVKSTLVSSKFLWITATLACLVIAGYNVYVLVSAYLSHQTITTITEKQRTSPDPYRMTTLVCDNQPYDLHAIERLGIPTPPQYYAELRHVFAAHASSTGANPYTIQLYLEELYSSRGYRQFLTAAQLDRLTQAQSHLVVSCFYLRRLGLFSQASACNDSNMMILKTTVPGFFNCYVLENKFANTDMHITGLELLLYMAGSNKPAHSTVIEEVVKIPLQNFQKIGVTILAIPFGTAQVRAKICTLVN